MARTQTEETRKKIGESVRSNHKVKAEAKALERQRVEATKVVDGRKAAAGAAFAKGHPEGLSPAAVRNYGDFGTSAIVQNVGESQAEETTGRLERRPEFAAALDRKCGKPGGVIRPSANAAITGGIGVPVSKP